MSDEISRRKFLHRAGLAGAVVALPVAGGAVGYFLPHGSSTTPAPANPAASTTPAGFHTFVSRPDLNVPVLTINRQNTVLGGLIFFAPKGYDKPSPGQEGCQIANHRGEPVWFSPNPHSGVARMGFTQQTYGGEPVLTWWEGTVVDGVGQGSGIIYDSSYRQVAEVRAGNGKAADLHEFLLTDRGTALLAAYDPQQADLTAVGGAKDGWVLAAYAQEIDIASGAVVFEWSGLDHIGVEESMQGLDNTGTKAAPYDYLHLNSIGVAPDGDLVISARNTSTVYKVGRTSGEIGWRLGGKKSDFAIDQDAQFSWQHDARMNADGIMSIFDNSVPGSRSRGMVLRLDTATMRASLDGAFVHPSGMQADNQGSTQMLKDGGALIGWGAQPNISQFAADGTMLWDARMPDADQSYRAFVFDGWTGTPTDVPAVAVRPHDAGGFTVYVSWNGATQARSWRVLAGSTATDLQPGVTVPRGGFETAVVVSALGPYFAVAALDNAGVELARSAPVHT